MCDYADDDGDDDPSVTLLLASDNEIHRPMQLNERPACILIIQPYHLMSTNYIIFTLKPLGQGFPLMTNEIQQVYWACSD